MNIDALKVGAKHPTLGQKRDDENLDTVDGSFSHVSFKPEYHLFLIILISFSSHSTQR